MNKKLFSILTVCLLGCIALPAAPVDEDAARDIAEQFAARTPQLKSSRSVQPAALTTAYVAARAAGGNYYYVFNQGDQGGCIIVSGDDRAGQVLGYTIQGSFCYDSIPPAMRWWLGQYQQQMEHLLAQPDSQVTAQPQQSVSTLPAGQLHSASSRAQAVRAFGASVPKSATKASDGYLAPLLGDIAWDQDAPYNDLCPAVWNGGRAYTGCVATAMAQIMDYYLWPVQGIGSHSYTCEVEGGDTRTLTADFGSTRYDWGNMLTTYASGQYTSTQATAIATLMYHCGVSVEIGYGASVSGAYSGNVPRALYTYFDYDGGISYKQHAYYSDAEWEDFVRAELDADRPVYYSGQSNEGGHAFVCDGYDGSYYHFNWGWSGYCNGYFLLDALNPEGQGIGGYEGGYNQAQAIITGIRPDAGGEVAGGELFCDGITPAQSSCPKESPFTLYGSFYNLGWNNMDAFELALLAFDTSGQLVETIPSPYGIFDELEPNYGYIFNEEDGGYQSTLPASLPDGAYKLFLAYRPAGNTSSASWQMMRTNRAATNCIVATVSGHLVRFEADADWSMSTDAPAPTVLLQESALPPAQLPQHQDCPFTVTLLNHGATFTGEVQALLYAEDAASLYEDYYQVIDDVSLDRGEKTTLRFDNWNVGGLALGRYIFQLAAVSDDGTYATGLLCDDGTAAAFYIEVVENAGPTLVLTDWNEAGDWPAAIHREVDFPLAVTLRNDGAAFRDSIYVVLLDGEGYIAYRSTPAFADLTNSDDETTLSFTLHVGDLPEGDYWLGLVYDEGGRLYLVANGEGANTFPASVVPLSLHALPDEAVLPARVYQYEDFGASVVFSNTGLADFHGNVILVLQDADRQAVYQSANVQVEVAANGSTAPAAWTCNVGDLPAGVYSVQFALPQQNGTRLYLPFSPEGNLTLEVAERNCDTGLDSPHGSPAIRLWPNPATDRVNIACPAGITRIRLHAPDGTLLTEQPGDGLPTCSLDVNRLSPGLYLLTVTTPDGTRTGRLVVK